MSGEKNQSSIDQSKLSGICSKPARDSVGGGIIVVGGMVVGSAKELAGEGPDVGGMGGGYSLIGVLAFDG